MRELPILFSAPMVRAILDGRKTVTRRVVKLPRDLAAIGGDLEQAHADLLWGVTPGLKVPCADDTVQRLRNPWMWPSEEGVRLWVKESCWLLGCDQGQPKVLPYGPDAALFAGDPPRVWCAVDGELPAVQEPWCWLRRNSIHMPRWASRITLAVTDVRAERLHEITEEDARAEGARYFSDLPATKLSPHARWSMEEPTSTERCLGTARMAFANLWDKINGDRAAWETNPWVWRVAFEVVR